MLPPSRWSLCCFFFIVIAIYVEPQPTQTDGFVTEEEEMQRLAAMRTALSNKTYKLKSNYMPWQLICIFVLMAVVAVYTVAVYLMMPVLDGKSGKEVNKEKPAPAKKEAKPLSKPKSKITTIEGGSPVTVQNSGCNTAKKGDSDRKKHKSSTAKSLTMKSTIKTAKSAVKTAKSKANEGEKTSKKGQGKDGKKNSKPSSKNKSSKKKTSSMTGISPARPESRKRSSKRKMPSMTAKSKSNSKQEKAPKSVKKKVAESVKEPEPRADGTPLSSEKLHSPTAPSEKMSSAKGPSILEKHQEM